MVTLGPVVAGSFYPARPAAVRDEVRRLLDAAHPTAVEGLCGLIAPHAGYRYSGPVAASAYALLAGMAFDRVALVGPSHFSWFSGVAAPAADTWAIPTGNFPIDLPAEAPAVERMQAPFAGEHCIEVQLPFLLETLGSVPIIPLLTGDVSPTETAAVLDSLLDDVTLLVVSTDLSHYLPYNVAVELDSETTAAVVAGEPDRLRPESACGLTGLRAGLLVAAARGWEIELLDYRNSGDTAGDRSRVVGYGAFALRSER
jgi:MEMO1 family protein